MSGLCHPCFARPNAPDSEHKGSGWQSNTNCAEGVASCEGLALEIVESCHPDWGRRVGL